MQSVETGISALKQLESLWPWRPIFMMGQCVPAYSSRDAGGRDMPLMVTMTGRIYLTMKTMTHVKRITTTHLTGPHIELRSVLQGRQSTSYRISPVSQMHDRHYKGWHLPFPKRGRLPFNFGERDQPYGEGAQPTY